MDAVAHTERGRAWRWRIATRLDWERDGGDWPNRSASRFVRAAGLRWHVQRMGRGPSLLLVHGTGASTHSWRDLAPALAAHFDVVAFDLPGHGFTQAPRRSGLSLPGMAERVGALLAVLDVRPDLVIGHSAGAALLARMCLDGRIEPARILSLNGALLPFRGLSGVAASPIARLLASNPLLPHVLAWRAADPRVVGALIRDTGSKLDARGLELYMRLCRSSGHVAATLGMMAAWDLAPLARDLPRLSTPLDLIVAERDRFIAPEEADRARSLVPEGRTIRLPALGHLAHEERPRQVAGIVAESAQA